MEWDKWQIEVIEHEGNVTIRKGRQVGGSTAIGFRAAKLMMKYEESNSLMIGPAQRQSSELFTKTLSWLMIAHQKAIEAAGGYKDDLGVSTRRNMELRRVYEAKNGILAEIPTKTIIKLKNGSILQSLPAGKTGIYLRSFALDFLYEDEAAYIPDTVHNALTPMLWVSKKKRGLGWKVYLSTPYGKGGFFYDSFTDEDFLTFHINSEDCIRIDRKDLLYWRKNKTKLEYAQEVQGEFVDEFQQYFPTALIKSCMENFIRWNFKEHYNKSLRYYKGVDYAGPGRDVNGFVDAEMQKNNDLKIVSAEEDDQPNTVKTNRKIIAQDKLFNYKKILVDSGGFGCGPTDELRELLGRKVIGINNSKKTIDREGIRTSKILKEDLYSNAKVLMEQGKIDIINDPMLLRSLKCMTFEYTEDKNLKISGRNNHLAEAFVRVCWAVKEKGLNLFVY